MIARRADLLSLERDVARDIARAIGHLAVWQREKIAKNWDRIDRRP